MKKMLVAGVAGAVLMGGAAMAEPLQLSNGQMDDVTAGFRLGLGGGIGTGPFAVTFGLGTGTSSSETGGGSLFTDTVNIGSNGSVALGSNYVSEGFSKSSVSYASTSGGGSWTGLNASGGALLTIP
jgi:hypothetical protein